jgi:hypothetical protein
MKIGYSILVVLLLTACGDPREIASKLVGEDYVLVSSDDKTGGARLCPKVTIDNLSVEAKKRESLECTEGEVIIPKDQMEQKLGFLEMRAVRNCTMTTCGDGNRKWRQVWCNPHC